MRLLPLFLSCLQICIGANIEWSSPETLFYSADYDISSPLIVTHPLLPQAQVVWIASGADQTVCSTTFDGSSWEIDPPIFTSPYPQSSLKLTTDSSGHYLAVWEASNGTNFEIRASQKTEMGWSSAISLQTVANSGDNLCLNIATSSSGLSVIGWQDENHRLNGLTFQSGAVVGSPYFLSDEGANVTHSAVDPALALFSTTKGLYATSFNPLSPPSPPTSAKVYPLPIQDTSFKLAFDYDDHRFITIFQDAKSLFLLSALSSTNWDCFVVNIPNSIILEAEVAVSGTSSRAAVAWRLSNNTIQAAIFNGRQWGSAKTLSTNGSNPKVIFHPTTDHPIVVWADFTAGGTSNAIKSSEFDLSNSWSLPQALSNAGSDLTVGNLSVQPEGTIFALWTRKETSDAKAKLEVARGM